MDIFGTYKPFESCMITPMVKKDGDFNSQQVGVQCQKKINHLEITELSKSSEHTAVMSCTLRNGGREDSSPWFKAEPQTPNASRTLYGFVHLSCAR